MKKFNVVILCAVLLLSAIVPASAGSLFSVVVSTYPVDEAATMEAQVAGEINLCDLMFANSGNTAQTITVYENSDSTTTVSSIATVVIPATAGFYRPFADLNYNNRINVEDISFRKSSTATDVYANGIYQ